VPLPRTQAHRLEGAARRLDAVPAEPSEQLLRAVADEQRPDDPTQRNSTKIHGCLQSLAAPPTGLLGRCPRETPSRRFARHDEGTQAQARAGAARAASSPPQRDGQVL
jgi:hypothetical protein